VAKAGRGKFKPTRFMLPDSRYDKERAGHAVAFIKNLRHTKGLWAGQPFYLLDWQEDLIRNIFGVIKKNGYRQFNTAFIELPKKSGKSELAAAVALYMLCADGEQSAEIYGCATDRQQAGIVFSVALDMILQCPALKKRVKIAESQKRIIFEPTRSVYQVLSSEVASKYGYNVHACIFDELLGQPNRKLYDVMTKGSGRRESSRLILSLPQPDLTKTAFAMRCTARRLTYLKAENMTRRFTLWCTVRPRMRTGRILAFGGRLTRLWA
jgi:phage terminase large subunit-like protein